MLSSVKYYSIIDEQKGKLVTKITNEISRDFTAYFWWG
ncbi:hypothetical protein CHK_0246 [Christensenella hongkongensis]|uniref:Uncharacterized protein n=1 Tax=Christensenella hongkongensis TaxID=270498 RepID=A0A0M2NIZ6_9FIRM|nr:hypothetical protein CHK_0246 [Christensenella hongkongensis]